MDNPILSKLQTAPGEPTTNGIHGIEDREGFIAESLKLIRKVITGRRSIATDDIPDIAQDVALNAETVLLVQTVWQGICKLSLYQRQALLFSSVDLVLYLLQCGVDEDALLRELELSRTAWESVGARMPLTDAEIAEIANPGSGGRRTKTTANAVKKARFDARKRLKELMK